MIGARHCRRSPQNYVLICKDIGDVTSCLVLTPSRGAGVLLQFQRCLSLRYSIFWVIHFVRLISTSITKIASCLRGSAALSRASVDAAVVLTIPRRQGARVAPVAVVHNRAHRAGLTRARPGQRNTGGPTRLSRVLQGMLLGGMVRPKARGTRAEGPVALILDHNRPGPRRHHFVAFAAPLRGTAGTVTTFRRCMLVCTWKRMSCRSFRGASAASGRGSPVSLGHSWIVGVPHYHTQAPVTLLSISRVVPLCSRISLAFDPMLDFWSG